VVHVRVIHVRMVHVLVSMGASWARAVAAARRIVSAAANREVDGG